MRFFDITRLCKRATFPGPSGIDRVDLAYLNRLRSVGPVEYLVNGVAGFSVIDPRLGDAFGDKLQAVWRGEQDPFTASQLAPLCDNSRRVRMAGKWQARRRGLAGIHATQSLHELCESGIAGLDLLDASAGEGAYRVDNRWRANGKGGCFFGISHSMLGRSAYLSALARHPDLKRVMFIHDTIPCDFPEYCREHEGPKHLLRLRNAFRYATHLVVNSEYTARQLDHWRRKMGAPELPVAVIPIGVDPGVLSHADGATAVPSHRPYFVMLGTIEPRKNHALLVHLWREFTENLPPEEIPELLIIGRRGWDNESVFRLLDRCESLRGHVREMNGVLDDELWPLLHGARAMLFPSFVEGWGMPMVEALAMGVPVIGSDIAPFQEAGQGIPTLLSPLDGSGWNKAILEFSRNDSPTRLAQIEQLENYHPPTWDGHFEKLAEFLNEPSLAEGRG
ncbi:MAG: glycosyltransferase family 1 protein [Luteolibacter sp.]|uniref:glycosyltransferase family 4 protein n=1 Tax=Luteolibacter sp. TaxID=1962973 RepID=UPI0032653204